MLSHVEQMLRDMPEVESTSRRTGLQLGLAAVTEANRGDISVQAQSDSAAAASTKSSADVAGQDRQSRNRCWTWSSSRFCRT